MNRSVIQKPQDGLSAMRRYGMIACVIGVLGLGFFVIYAMEVDPPHHGQAASMLGFSIAAQWVWLIVQYAPGYRTLLREAEAGWDQERSSRLIVAGALADAGWAMLFAAAALGAFATGTFATLEVPTYAVLVAALIFVLMPGALVILSLVVLARRGQNAR
jgi:hypothetical protein